MTRTTLRTRLAAIAIVGVLAGGATACGSSTQASSPTTGHTSNPTSSPTAATSPSSTQSTTNGVSAKTAAVDIVNFSFKPDKVTIRVGGTVTWKQVDSVGHSVQSMSKPPLWTTSPVMKPGQTFSHTFTKAGTYPYICGVHNFMMGTVVVVK
jgi:plastocyanin